MQLSAASAGLSLKVGEYIDLAETLRGMANHQREATIRREIVGRIDEGDESRPFFPKLEAFLAELNSRVEKCAASLRISVINL